MCVLLSFRAVAVPALFALILAACYTGPADTSRASDPDGTREPDAGSVWAAPAGKIVLSLLQARRSKHGGEWDALELKILLRNGDGAPTIALDPALFKVRDTGDGWTVASAEQAPRWLDGTPCRSGVGLLGGTSASCTLNVPLKSSINEVIELRYEPPGDARSARIGIDVEECTSCGTVCTYLDADTEHCGACDALVGAGMHCTAGGRECNNPDFDICGSACVDLASDPKNCGACGLVSPTGSCARALPGCPDEKTYCTDHCVSLLTDPDHCGTCGAKVPAGGICANGFGTCPSGKYACGMPAVCLDTPCPP